MVFGALFFKQERWCFTILDRARMRRSMHVVGSLHCLYQARSTSTASLATAVAQTIAQVRPWFRGLCGAPPASLADDYSVPIRGNRVVHHVLLAQSGVQVRKVVSMRSWHSSTRENMENSRTSTPYPIPPPPIRTRASKVSLQSSQHCLSGVLPNAPSMDRAYNVRRWLCVSEDSAWNQPSMYCKPHTMSDMSEMRNEVPQG